MTHLHVWHDSSICVTWIIHMCDMINSCVWHDPFTTKFTKKRQNEAGRCKCDDSKANTATTLQRHCSSTAAALQKARKLTISTRIGKADANVRITKQTLQQQCNNTSTTLQQHCNSTAPYDFNSQNRERGCQRDDSKANTATTLQQHCNSTATALHLTTSIAKIGTWMPAWWFQSKHCNNTATTLQQHCNNTATALHLMTSTAKIGNVDASVIIPKPSSACPPDALPADSWYMYICIRVHNMHMYMCTCYIRIHSKALQCLSSGRFTCGLLIYMYMYMCT